MVKVKRNLKYFWWLEINCVTNLGSDILVVSSLEYAKWKKLSILSFWLERTQLWLPLNREKYGKSRSLPWWHLSLSSCWVQRILFLGLRAWNSMLWKDPFKAGEKWNSSSVFCFPVFPALLLCVFWRLLNHHRFWSCKSFGPHLF